ncbi:DUF5709 domain-containing protein [Streptomyces sp. NBC_01795]|uniref:DUF5709 domain-containing protein n=1 Tax=unclassified Streptomyces TaxID=2593676 RepID=UPI002DDBBD99|nr:MULTISPECIES: DUF5709 domain-containing protein [unclassified Streptomyces]WSA90892.1 DUF5709 domain-containing protein [Streptomyces sp. NBC_01795]WSB75215.1 DUF5709 domain-containing protein [Streptomyces sp. NBC_01775]WSS16501.1 DUF5709 domain-containing protein [Streptomyces sp. NBC_01186]
MTGDTGDGRTGGAEDLRAAGDDLRAVGDTVSTDDAAEIGEGPVEGVEPGERVERGPWSPPVEVDPPPLTRGADEGGPDTSFLTPYAEDASERTVPSDPGGDPEDEGIPDLQDGTPEQQRSSDPQQQPVPGDSPTAPTLAAPTPAELREGESLDERLAEEAPEETVADAVSGPPSEPAGRLHEDVEPMPPRRQDVYARETGVGGLSAEEEAVREVDEGAA